ncbi:MAG: helix-hairpin-helix domain-containing protein [bacterium]
MKFKKLKALYIKFGFTETEGNVILFLSIFFIIGFAIFTLKNTDSTKKINFEYSTEDSIFNASKTDSVLIINSKNSIKSKQKVSKFNKIKSVQKLNNKTIGFKRINLNTSTKETLMQIPGIGEKTAADIITLRTKNGKINSLIDLMEIKGMKRNIITQLRAYVIIE